MAPLLRALRPCALFVCLAACDAPTFPEQIEQSSQPTLRPGQNFAFPSEHHLTLSGDYGLPAGSYAITFTCTEEVDYRIDDQVGRRNGKCKRTGISNSVTESGVVGPATLGIAIVTGTVDVKLR